MPNESGNAIFFIKLDLPTTGLIYKYKNTHNIYLNDNFP